MPSAQTMASPMLTSVPHLGYYSRVNPRTVLKDSQPWKKLSQLPLSTSLLSFCPWLLSVLLVWQDQRPERDLLISNGAWSRMHGLDDLLKMENGPPLQSSQTIKLRNPVSALWVLTPDNDAKFFTRAP